MRMHPVSKADHSASAKPPPRYSHGTSAHQSRAGGGAARPPRAPDALVIAPIDHPLEGDAQEIAGKIMDCNPPRLPRRESAGRVPDSFPVRAPESVLRALSEFGRPLDPGPRAFMEARFGRDFSDVRLHDGGVAAQSAREIGARAYTAGNHIVFAEAASGRDGPGNPRLLAHELTHVVQADGEAGARVVYRAPATEAAGTPVFPDKSAALPTAVPVDLAPILARIEDLLSYGLFDWAVTDSDALAALDLLAAIPDVQLPAAITSLGPKYLTRLIDNLPGPAKAGDAYARILAAAGTRGLLGFAQEELSYGFFDWAVTDAEVDRIFAAFATLAAPEREKFLVGLASAGRLGRLVSNSNARHHELYLRPWIASLQRGAPTGAQRRILKQIVLETGSLKTLKLATEIRFDVSVEKRPIPGGKTAVEWNANLLREAYLVLDGLPEAHVAKNPQLAFLVEINEAGRPTADGRIEKVGGRFYRTGEKLITLNVAATEDRESSIRHETGHSVDLLVGWMEKKTYAHSWAGGWTYYDMDRRACAREMIEASQGAMSKLPHAQKEDVAKLMVGPMSARRHVDFDEWFNNLGWYRALDKKTRAAIISDKVLKTVDSGKEDQWKRDLRDDDKLGPHAYLSGYLPRWSRYEHKAREKRFTTGAWSYQFRDPAEWFGEAYAAYYGPGGRELVGRINPEAKAYFDEVVDKLAAPDKVDKKPVEAK